MVETHSKITLFYLTNLCPSMMNLFFLSLCCTVPDYLSVKAPVILDLQKMAGGATNGASVMVGSHMGVVTKIKDVVPKFISTHCSAIH